MGVSRGTWINQKFPAGALCAQVPILVKKPDFIFVLLFIALVLKRIELIGKLYAVICELSLVTPLEQTPNWPNELVLHVGEVGTDSRGKMVES